MDRRGRVEGLQGEAVAAYYLPSVAEIDKGRHVGAHRKEGFAGADRDNQVRQARGHDLRYSVLPVRTHKTGNAALGRAQDALEFRYLFI
jgi:hypothetical protein